MFKKTMEDIQKFTDKNPLIVKVAKMTSGAIGKVAKEIGDTMQGILDTVLGKMDFGNVFQSLFKGDISGTFKNLFGGIIKKDEDRTKEELKNIEDSRKAEIDKVDKENQAEIDAINAKYDKLKNSAELKGFSGLMKRFNDSFDAVLNKLSPVLEQLFVAMEPMIEPMTQILEILIIMLIEILKPMTPLLIKLAVFKIFLLRNTVLRQAYLLDVSCSNNVFCPNHCWLYNAILHIQASMLIHHQETCQSLLCDALFLCLHVQ